MLKKQQLPCEVLIDPQLQAEIPAHWLSKLGLSSGSPAAWRLILTTSLIHPELAKLDCIGGSGRLPFCPVELGADGAVRLGPLYAGDGAICFACVFSRLTRNGYQPLPSGDPSLALDNLRRVLGETLDPLPVSIAEAGGFGPGLVRWHPLWPDTDCPRCRRQTRLPALDDLAGPLTGAVRDMVVTPIADGLYVAEGECSPAVMTSFRGGSRRVRRLRVQGAGLDPLAAKLRCAGEAVERTSLILDPADPIEWAAYRDISQRAARPEELLLDSESFDPGESRPWTPAIAPDGAPCLVPAELCYFAYDSPLPGADSSGCAAGPTIAFARERALFEAIERDAVTIWWRRRAMLPPVDPSGFSQREFAAVRAFLIARQRDWWLLDASTDLGKVAIAVSPGAGGAGIALGCGSGWTLEEASARALRELAVTIYAPPGHPGAVAWRDVPIAAVPHLSPAASSSGKSVPAGSPPVCPPHYVKHHTKPYWGWPVIRVLGPGWCAFDRYRGSTRMRDLPDILGWRCLNRPDQPDSRPWPA